MSNTMKPSRYKFRAWDKKNKIISAITMFLFDSQEIDTEDNLNEPKNFEHFEIMQSTGLTDKNGKEVFEGDVVRFKIPEYTGDFDKFEEIISVVFWDEDEAEFSAEGMYHNPEEKMSFESLEIIGNKFSSPELLNAKN